MRSFFAASLAATALTFVASWNVAAAADADPTVHQIYEAASTGHLDQAQQMMDQVLRDHPNSAKAHYVQAELYAREGKAALARSELGRAEQLKPGLPDENPRSVQALKSELGLGGRTLQGEGALGARPAAAEAHFPWGTLVILALVVGVFWMIFRRRRSYVQYPAGGGMPGGPPVPTRAAQPVPTVRAAMWARAVRSVAAWARASQVVSLEVSRPVRASLPVKNWRTISSTAASVKAR